jgi:hypothetical protein
MVPRGADIRLAFAPGAGHPTTVSKYLYCADPCLIAASISGVSSVSTTAPPFVCRSVATAKINSPISPNAPWRLYSL